jgi:hypothetical protein
MGWLRAWARIRKIAGALLTPWGLSMRATLASGRTVTVRWTYEAVLPLDEMAVHIAYVRGRIEKAGST